MRLTLSEASGSLMFLAQLGIADASLRRPRAKGLSSEAAVAASLGGAIDLEMMLPCLSFREAPTHRDLCTVTPDSTTDALLLFATRPIFKPLGFLLARNS